MAKLRELIIAPQVKERLVQGHPWIYRDTLPRESHFATGEWLKLRCGHWSGFGLWESKGPIAVRIFSCRQLPDPAWFRARVRQAWELRAPLRQQDCTAYRWLFGEGDGLPGLTVDLYGPYAVVQTYMEGGQRLLDWLGPALRQMTPLQGILWRTKHLETLDPNQAQDTKTQLLWGQDPPDQITVQEHGLAFQVNLHTSQKTGLFLDHRENRHFIGPLCAQKSVLNCFAYTGAFSLYALRAGARQVTSVDMGKNLAAVAEANIRLNHLDPRRHDFVTADCFELLQRYRQAQQTFEVVILDPPSFAKSKQHRFAALRAYTKLNALALQCLAANGLLVSASCTSQVGPEVFREMLASAAAQSQRRLQILHEAGQPLDHPVPVGFPEGRYLKFVVCQVSDLV